MMKARLFILLASVFLISSCATLFKGTKQVVRFDSYPQGAKVLVNNEERGVTPVDIKLKREITGPVVVLTKENYKAETVIPETQLEKMAILNMGVVPYWGIDLITGAMWKYKNDEIKVVLIPLDPSKQGQDNKK